MIEIPSLRPETRYGIPNADHFLFNREYIVGYSYLFRQARWAMEVIDPENSIDVVDRQDSFRPDLRIPPQFRADLEHFSGSGFDRGHLVSSADRRAKRVENSETFLLSNMSPQHPQFNRGIWKRLEGEVRELARNYVEVYVICGPLFEVGKTVDVIGESVVVPHGYFKSVLAEDDRGHHDLWSFAFPNERCDRPLEDYLVATTDIERRAGLQLWDRLRGRKIEGLEGRKGRIWKLD